MEKKNIKIYADGANIDDMIKAYESGEVEGFTTNPTLMKKAGITDYKGFAKEVVKKIPDLSVSFEVFGDDFATMEKEALILKTYGENVFVKIPIQTTKGELSIDLIKSLSEQGVNLNVTAVFTIEQVKRVLEVISPNSKVIISIFAGRIADTGRDPKPIMKEAYELCKNYENVELLWASTREIYNLIEAEETGCDIITIQNDILKKKAFFNKSLDEMSLETVKGFNKDVKDLGFSIL